MTRNEIVAEARTWLNVPYRPRGRSRLGIDCLGLLVVVAQHFDVSHEDRQDYKLWPDKDHALIRALGTYLRTLPMNDAPQPGCVGLFCERTLPGHVGIFSLQHDTTHVIHARITPPRVLEQAWVPGSEMRLIAMFDLPGVAA